MGSGGIFPAPPAGDRSDGHSNEGPLRAAEPYPEPDHHGNRDERQQCDAHIDEDFCECAAPQNVRTIHDVPGGTAPARVHEAIVIARKKLGSIHEEAHAHA